MRFEDRETARELRREGWTLPEIAQELVAGKGLVSLWVRDVIIRPNGLQRLASRKVKMSSGKLGRTWRSKKCKDRREVYRQQGRLAAKRAEALHAVACALYWGEGSKERNVTLITNTDVNILRMFVRFCRTYFKVRNEDFTIRISGYTNVHSADKMVDYWLSALKLKGATQRKHDLDNTKYASRGHNKATVGRHPYGCCAIAVKRSTHIIQHIYGAIEVYGGTVFDPHAAPRRPKRRKPTLVD